jgi:hypothetical protein
VDREPAVTGAGVLHQDVKPSTLGVVRAAVFLMWLAVVVPDPLSFLAELPPAMNHPLGVFGLVPGEAWRRLLEPGALVAFKAVLVGLLVLSALGMRPYRPIVAATAGLLTVHQALLRGFTFDNHEELGLLVCTYVLVLFPAADGFAWPRRRLPSAPPAVYSAALLAMAGLLLVPYAGIAAHRLAFAAPGVFVGDSLPAWIASLHSLDRDGSGFGLWLLGHPALVPVLKAGFGVTTIFELCAPLCLVMPRFRRAWIAVVVSFHILNWFTLNLFFWQNALLILLIVTDTEAWVSRARRLARGASCDLHPRSSPLTQRQPVVNTGRSGSVDTGRAIQ